MLKMGLADIRKLYMSDVAWLARYAKRAALRCPMPVVTLNRAELEEMVGADVHTMLSCFLASGQMLSASRRDTGRVFPKQA